MTNGLVPARWVGPGGLQLDNGVTLVPHETIVDIPQGEAVGSDNWELAALPQTTITVSEASSAATETPSLGKEN